MRVRARAQPLAVLTAGYAARLGRGGAVPLLLLSQIFLNIGIGTYGVLYNLCLTAFGQPLAFIGVFNAVSLLSLGASAIPIGALTHRIGHRRMLSTGAVLLVVVQVVLAVTTEPATLIAASMLWGIAQALTVVPVAPLLSESVPVMQQASVFGRLFAAWSLAAVVGSILGGALPGMLAALFPLGQASGAAAYRSALLATTLITLLGWPLLLVPTPTRKEQSSRTEADEPMGSGWALRSVRRTAGAVAVTMALYSFACGLVASFMNVYFAEHLHQSTLVVGVLFAVAALLGMVGSLLGPRVRRRLGSVRAVAVLRLAVVPCLLILTLGMVSPYVAMLGFALRSALVYAAGALDYHFALAAVPARSRSLLSGLRTGTLNVFFALGTWSAGYLIPQMGYPALFLWSAAVTAVSGLLFLGLFGAPRAAR